MSREGTTCKQCGKKYHNCASCGNEAWMDDYCSKDCVERSDMIVCYACNGWGCAYDPDLPYDHPDQEGDPRCNYGMISWAEITYTKDRSWLQARDHVSTQMSAPAVGGSLKKAIVLRRPSS